MFVPRRLFTKRLLSAAIKSNTLKSIKRFYKNSILVSYALASIIPPFSIPTKANNMFFPNSNSTEGIILQQTLVLDSTQMFRIGVCAFI